MNSIILFYGFIIIPSRIRHIVYDWIAKNRYKWFGKKESCMLPPPSIRNRSKHTLYVIFPIIFMKNPLIILFLLPIL
ncbi:MULTISPECIES: hypothetical protein [Bacillaceae]|uniref:Uncharacterized protein n=1 Tax=Domibacillus aminovorans TaxID=29332 RepID=A0A177L2G0_9BACI|nr:MULTISPECIES: hypothetical protein [Bacillaceae]OAH59636.1 hypothetical protein AWH48_00585 [Domibacillus aminovorans]